MSFFDELKRRNVFRVGIAHVVGAWLLAQVADLSEALVTPTAFPITRWQLHYDPNWDFFRDDPGFIELTTPANLVREARL